jgi:hypothetical protein
LPGGWTRCHDQFVEELVTEDSAVTGYLVAEVLNPQPPAVRDGCVLGGPDMANFATYIPFRLAAHAFAYGF